MMDKLRLTFAALTVIALASVTGAQTTVSTGHVDIFGVGYSAGELGFMIHDEDGLGKLEPADTVLQVNAGGLVLRPAPAAFDFLGPWGSSLWIMPQSNIESVNRGVMYAGASTEEIDASDWGMGSAITVRLLNVISAPVGGSFFLWSEDEVGNPTQFMNSTDLGLYNSLVLERFK